MVDVRLITLDPGHFHAALVQKVAYPGVAERVHVFARLGPDLLSHLGRIAAFNARSEQPTRWELEVHAGPDFLARMVHEKPGNVVVISGRNRGKIDYVLAAMEAGLNVLADKPWIIEAEDLPKLQRALDLAQDNRLVAYDIMTERHEITSILQRELVNDPDVFGNLVTGTAAAPAVVMESVHYLSKLVAGAPLRRPAWFFDVAQQGEGLTDVGTHLVDLVPWIAFPEQPIGVADVRITSAERWPTVLSRADFEKVTGEPDFPNFLADSIAGGKLDYFCNTRVAYAVRGIHVRLDVAWDFEAPAGGGDTHFAVFHGSRARVEVRQGAEQRFRPELYVVANDPERPDVEKALVHRMSVVQERFAGTAIVQDGNAWRVIIPDQYRIGHEAHFGEVARDFLASLADPGRMPSWEKPNMVAKYATTTEGVRRARETCS
jgi:predicted dehydrogenase